MSFICPITQNDIKDPIEITRCGHLFEKIALFEHIIRNTYVCPMCRTAFDIDDLYVSRTLQQLLQSKKDVACQTDDDLFEKCIFFARDGLVNPRNRLLNQHINAKNTNAKFFKFDENKINIQQYLYHHVNNSIASAINMLSESGYYIYDIYRQPLGGDNAFIVLSANHTYENEPNFLTRF